MLDSDGHLAPYGPTEEHYESASVCYGGNNGAMQTWDGEEEEEGEQGGYSDYAAGGEVMTSMWCQVLLKLKECKKVV